jgi:hypothetical protein
MSYQKLRYRIDSIKRDGVDIPIQGNERFRDTLEIMFNLDMLEKEVINSDFGEAKRLLQEIVSK